MSGRRTMNDHRLRERINNHFCGVHVQVHPARSLRASLPLLTNPPRTYTCIVYYLTHDGGDRTSPGKRRKLFFCFPLSPT